MLTVTFQGVRGSTPCPGPGYVRYGGHTACVVLEAAGQDPIVFDLGTGLRRWAEALPSSQPLRATALITHLHLDHVQGLPFFAPADRPGTVIDVFGPPLNGQPLAEAFAGFMGPPWFPIRPEGLSGSVRFHDLAAGELDLAGASVTVRPVPHRGPTLGYRVEWAGASVAYVSDHQAPSGLDTIDESVLALADGVDLLIHDAQYTPDQWAVRAHWGHCTIDYAVLVAREAGARRLALFHHDPAHHDDELDALVAGARRTAQRLGGAEVFAAAEGMVLSLG